MHKPGKIRLQSCKTIGLRFEYLLPANHWCRVRLLHQLGSVEPAGDKEGVSALHFLEKVYLRRNSPQVGSLADRVDVTNSQTDLRKWKDKLS